MATKKKSADAAPAYQIPIGPLMNAVDKRNKNYYTQLKNELTDDQFKKFSTYMIQRWASCVDGPLELQEQYIINLNDYSNLDYIATTSEHDELRWMAIALCGLGDKRTTIKHNFIPPKGKKTDKLTAWLIEQFPQMNDSEIELFRELNGDGVLQDMAEAKNLGDKKIKELFK